ncbi:penicillin acylase family protein [Mucilaginibacter sp. Bleaf8]|uniref:penicillin acylase family protein n=1 Tax=Mucilaginibacter sp. Bleaf8 TaxID=2834430 RepID=UPI001BCB8F42|nr:penicillin acylase family protein [Mucilaginibacter sp. Bleaf8]MBS7564624.1 penicillin acylase family protein [Mucilaginibacter sp. Bleaf8]
MKKLLLALCCLLPALAMAQKSTLAEITRYQAQAKRVTIIRDNWGVPHIYAKTDADVVFGLLYAQCEENFKGIERNYLYQLGKQAHADGESSLYTDVQLQLIADSADAIKEYRNSPLWFKKLMDAFADGINYYLYQHPETKPQVLKHFEPWYALMFTDGSVSATVTGGINLNETRQFYSGAPDARYGAIKAPALSLEDKAFDREIGSNGFAIGPAKSASGHAMLYINPHVPFYFRSEVHLVSEEGLNAYGAVTWGQFFIYQGFNPHCGWMHTSSNADVGDVYLEKVTKKGAAWFYEYNGQQKPVTQRKLTINCKKGDSIVPVTITGFYTHHGPVLGSRNGQWLSMKANNRSYNALLESWLITKANNYAAYKKAMDLLSNATNNTVYADDKGNIAFWYGNFMPKRDAKLDWTQPVDGTTPATEWQGLHTLSEIVQLHNPKAGWIQNCNATPYASAGAESPAASQYPAYMAPDGQNYRGINAIRLFDNPEKLTLDQLIGKGYDRYLAAFDVLLPPLFKAYEQVSDTALKRVLTPPIQHLQKWDRNSAVNSVATTLAVEWGTRILGALPRPASAEEGTYQTKRVEQLIQSITSEQLMATLLETMADLRNRYGTWQVQWGYINRYQRPADGITYNDSLPSLPAASTASTFGQLPSFVSRVATNTRKRYGYSGNSFIAAVEFGPRIKAKSIITGGQSFSPASRHFADQAQMYLDGKFKDILFYKEDVLKHAERKYHPGE